MHWTGARGRRQRQGGRGQGSRLDGCCADILQSRWPKGAGLQLFRLLLLPHGMPSRHGSTH